MTRVEFLNLRLDQVYEFSFYYGEKACGVIIEEQQGNDIKHYIVKMENMREYREINSTEEKIKKGLMKLINIETITHCKVIS